METPHHRRHRKLDTTDRRKCEKSAKRRINNTVPKQAPLTSRVGASDHPGTDLSVQMKALDWIGQETGEVRYMPLRLGGWKRNGWRTHLTQLPTSFLPKKEDE